MIRLSHYEYELSMQIACQNYPFYALIAAAIRQADSRNLDILRSYWPGIYESLVTRRNAPGGIVPEWDGIDAPQD